MSDGVSIQTKRRLLELEREMAPSQSQQATEPSYKTGGLSAAESQARALGLSLEQLRQRQMDQFRALAQGRRGYAEGGGVQGFLSSLAKGAQQGATMRAESEARTPEYNAAILKSLLVPEDAVDVGLMAATGPFGKLGKLGGLALAGGGYAPEAEAGTLQKLLQLMYRGRSSNTPVEEARAIFMSPQKGYAAEYAARRASQNGGDGLVDSYLVDPFGVERRGHNMLPKGGGNRQSKIAYPKEGEYKYVGTEPAKKAQGGEVRIDDDFSMPGHF